MPVYRVNVKWQKERFKDVECNTDESPYVFKAMLFSLTGVPPDRQKVMLPGKILGDDNFDGVKLKDGMTIMLIGTCDDIPTHQTVAPDMEEQIATPPDLIKVPFGLVNLGNTCYMNATIQLLYSIPELRTALEVYEPPPTEVRSGLSLIQCLRQLFSSLKNAKDAVVPGIFVTCLRTVYPQFATTARNDSKKDASMGSLRAMLGGDFLQQDANECWVELVRTLQSVVIDPKTRPNLPDILKDPSSTKSWNFVDRFFTGHLTCKLTCTEAEDEVSETAESFTQLSCFINQDVKFLHTGIRNGFEGTLTKRSPTLGRDVVYKKSSAITRLPAYLCIHFVRFFYKEDKQINAKILKDVKFPLELDLYSFCSEALQKQLLPTRAKMKEHEDRAVHSFSKSDKSANRNGKDNKPPNPTKNPELFLPYSLPDDPGSNNSGFYELMGVLSHQGRTSSSGHYVAWVKVEGDWVKFDDDVVTFVTPEDILRLSGGGDWHCAYVLLYGPKRLMKDNVEVAGAETASAEVQKEASVDPLSGDRRAE